MTVDIIEGMIAVTAASLGLDSQPASKNIACVSVESIESVDLLSHRMNVTFNYLQNTSELFPLIGNITTKLDLILFDLQKLYETKGVCVIDVINTITTLSKCSGSNCQTTPIAVLVDCSTDMKLLKEVISSGIKGIVPKGPAFSSDEKETAVRMLLTGQTYLPRQLMSKITNKTHGCSITTPTVISLTPRQRQILSLVKDRGASNKIIAKTLNISESTVKLHMSAIFKKYGVQSRTQLAVFS